MPLFDSVVLSDLTDMHDLDIANGLTSLSSNDGMSVLHGTVFGSPSKFEFRDTSADYELEDEVGGGVDLLGLDLSLGFSERMNVGITADSRILTNDSDYGKSNKLSRCIIQRQPFV